ncbi:uncharacterized protein LOC111920980 [Lactuca sativa]|uniref:uncharacterized protein LOC111920980 n=1 Tax=Lactuca sativa TaxID=4236 RepID=UPI000CD97C66|nr:uncharacterized protein LOC111920980 [Lactuca sativa]
MAGETPEGSGVPKETPVDFDDPLYVHPSDNTVTSIITVKLTGNENYRLWRSAMSRGLKARNKLGFVDGSISETIYASHVYSDKAKDIWDELFETYNKADGSVIFNIHYQINTLKQNGSSLSDYFNKLDSLWKEFDGLTSLTECVCEAATKLNDHSKLMKLMQFLSGLDDVYNQVKSQILLMEPLPNVKSAFSILFREESLQKNGSLGSTDFKFKNDNNNQNKFVSVNSSSASANNSKSVSSESGLGSDAHFLTGEQYSKFLRLISENSACDDVSATANIAGMSVFQCCNSFVSSNDSQSWIVDSVANQHMIASESQLKDAIDVSKLNLSVKHPNGSSASINKIGNLQLSSHLTLFDVFAVPDFNDSLSKQMVDNGRESGGLYYLDYVPSVRSDNGTEFVNNQMKFFCFEKGIIHQTSCAYTPQQNGVVERKHRHILNVARSLLFQSGVPIKYWGDAILTSVFLINRMPTSVLNGQSPYELVFQRTPSFDYLRVFGCLCFAVKPNVFDKLSERAEKCILLGYCSDKKAYKLLSLDTNSSFVSRDVKFYESFFPYKLKSTSVDKVSNNFGPSDLFSYDEFDNNKYINDYINLDELRVESQLDGADAAIGMDDVDSSNSVNPGGEAIMPPTGSSVPSSSSVSEENSQSILTPSMDQFIGVSRSRRESHMPVNFADYIVDGKYKYGVERSVNYSFLDSETKCFISNLNKTVEPKSYNEAFSDPNWIKAMNDEMEALHRNNTWEITDLPKNRKPIGCKWVYKIKYKSNGEIDRYKARLVAKGYNQREGIDFEETFSPVAKIVTVRILISLSVHYSWSLYQLDINNAFLYGDLAEDVYMSLPPGYYSSNDTRVCKLIKSLYGLKQAPRKWNEKLCASLFMFGFKQSISDYSLFIRKVEGSITVLLVYVDDIILTGNSEVELKKVKSFMNSQFLIKDLGTLTPCSRVEINEGSGEKRRELERKKESRVFPSLFFGVIWEERKGNHNIVFSPNLPPKSERFGEKRIIDKKNPYDYQTTP